MSTVKQNPLANLIRAAVGFQNSTSGCCGPATVTIPTVRSSRTEPAEISTRESCGCSTPVASTPSAQDTGAAEATQCQCGNQTPSCCG